MDTIYISFDQSLNKTGFCVWKNGEYYTHGLIDCHKDKDDKLINMSYNILNIIKTYCPKIITIEDTALQSNAKTLKQLSQLQGIIIGFCISHNVDYNIYSPSEWRKILNFKIGKGVKRDELKEMAVNYVKENYKMCVSVDEAESICIGEAVLSQY